MKYILVLVFVGLSLTSCQKKSDYATYEEQFLRLKPSDKGFEKALKKVSEGLYAEKWGGKFRFDKPTIRKEKMLVEWENKTSNRVVRKVSSLRYTDLPEKLALLLLFSHLGPVAPEKLLASDLFFKFKSELVTYLKSEDEASLADVKLVHGDILKFYKISEAKAKENENLYNVGVLYATGFYLGMPFYKRITLGAEIQTRYTFLKVYLHECGHQLFDKHRKFSKSVKLGLSWIGWRKSAASWWTVEEKSCNIFSDMIMDKEGPFIKRLSIEQKKQMIEVLSEDTIKSFEKNDNMAHLYAQLFYDTKKAEERYLNKRINDRYSVNDGIGVFLKKNVEEKGVLGYIKAINKCFDTKEVLAVLKKGESVIK